MLSGNREQSFGDPIFFIDVIASIKSKLKARLFNIGLTILQWRVVTSEAGHAVGMLKLVMQLTCNTLWVGQKFVWNSKTKTNFCHKIIAFSKKKVFT